MSKVLPKGRRHVTVEVERTGRSSGGRCALTLALIVVLLALGVIAGVAVLHLSPS